jgi:hypothetical protein
MDTTSFAEGVIDGLEASCDPEGRIPHDRPVTLQFTNATVHNSKHLKDNLIAFDVIRMKHPRCRPDLEPCDFFLFNGINEKVRDTVFNDDEEFSVAIRDIVKAIPGDLLISAFSQWVKRARDYIDNNGDYVE